MKKKVKVLKTYRGLVDLRDYDVKKCIEENIPIEVQFNNDVMTLSPKQLKEEIMATSKTFTYTDKSGKSNSYKLYGYVWEPDEVEL